jgi:ribonuclease-3
MLDLQFTNPDWLVQAFTFVPPAEPPDHYQGHHRLEFLGDGVLTLAVRTWLSLEFGLDENSSLTNLTSALTCNKTLVSLGRELGLPTYRVGPLPETGLETKMPADLVEAVIGAVYMDGGYDHAADFIWRRFFPRLCKLAVVRVHPKSILQYHMYREYGPSQAEIEYRRSELPQVDRSGHSIWRVGIYRGSEFMAFGTGRDVRRAEEVAACKVLQTVFGMTEQEIQDFNF